MAISLKPLYPTIREAKERRLELARYLNLDGGKRLIAAALLLALMSALATGRPDQRTRRVAVAPGAGAVARRYRTARRRPETPTDADRPGPLYRDRFY